MASGNDTWVFRFFVSGKTSKTDYAVALLKQICEKYLEGMCDVQVIDVAQDPLASMEDNIIATPTLLKKLPEPARRIIGDLSDEKKLISTLGINE